jgi:hypothetical protein
LRSTAMENLSSISGTRLRHTAIFNARSRPRFLDCPANWRQS